MGGSSSNVPVKQHKRCEYKLSANLVRAHLDMVKVGCILKGRFVPVKVLQPSVKLRIVVSDGSRALKVTSVNWVVANNGGIKSDVGLCEFITYQVIFAFQ